MAKLYNEQTITDVGEGVKAYEGNTGQVLMGLSKELDDYSKEQEKEYITSMNAYAQGMKNLTTRSMQDIYTQYQNDPNKLQEEFNKLDNELINNIPDEDLKLQFKSEFLLDSSTYINRSKNNLKRIQEAQLKQSREQSLIESMNLRDSALYNMMSGVATADDIVNFRRTTENIGSMLKSKDAYGIYTFSPSQQDKYIKEMKESMGNAFLNKMYESEYDELSEANKKLSRNNYTVSFFDDDGSKKEVNIKDLVDAKTYKEIKDKTLSYYNKAKKAEFDYAYGDFLETPTEDGLERLKKLKPDMGDKKLETLELYLQNSPNYDAETTYSSYSDAVDEIIKVADTDYSDNEERNNAYLKVMTKANESNKEYSPEKGVGISADDLKQLKSDIVNNIMDADKSEMFRVGVPELKELLGWNLKTLTGLEKQYYNRRKKLIGNERYSSEFPMGQPSKIRTYHPYNIFLDHKLLDKMLQDGIKTQMGYIANGDIEGARKAKKEYKRRILEYLNPEIAGKKEGDVVVLNGVIYKISSIDDEVILENN